MKKVKQVLAIIGVIVLVGLYISTLVCALSSSPNFMNMFMASVMATVIVPVLLWAYSFIYKLLKNHYGPDSENTSTDSDKQE